MQINAQFDISNLKARTLREAKNLAISTSQALNSVAKDVQQDERIHLDRTYTLRKAGFMYRIIKIAKFSNAKQGVPFVEITIDKKQRVLLGIFEEGGERQPFKGKDVAVPITGGEARPTEQSTIPDEFTFKKMSFKKHVTKEGKTQWKGENGTFLIPDVGVFKRTDQPQKTERRAKSFVGRAGRVLQESKLVKLLYKLMAPGQLKKLQPNLHFKDTAQRVMQEKVSYYFHKNYDRYKN